jgi:hypothetical protein
MSEKSEPSKVRGNPVIKRLLKKQNKHKILSDTRFQVLIIVIFCAVAGIAFLVVKSLTSSYSLWPNNPIPNTITSANNSSKPTVFLQVSWHVLVYGAPSPSSSTR